MEIKSCVNNFLWGCDWNIGFFSLEKGIPSITPSIRWMQHSYKDGWFADPFILGVKNNVVEVLVEEYNYKSNLGRIDKLYVDLNGFVLKDIHILLELDTHLSFPAIYRDKDKVYIYPENAESGKVIIYEYNQRTEALVNPVILLNEPLVDVIIRKIDDCYYLFGTYFGTLEDNRTLFIYKSESLLGKYMQYDIRDLKDYTARGAGDWIDLSGKCIRPSQDGTDLNAYGKGIVFHEFMGIEKKPIFKELFRYYSTDKSYDLGLHTFNVFENLGVTDGIRYKRPLLGKVTRIIRNICFD